MALTNNVEVYFRPAEEAHYYRAVIQDDANRHTHTMPTSELEIIHEKIFLHTAIIS